jgi:uncharacterized protein YndB with AHSA1/START domain
MNLLFDFTVDKAAATIHVTREFAADLDLVWDAWTKAEILDIWWAPKPCRAITKKMDFREGGHWLYEMNCPPQYGSTWCLVNYIKIEAKSSFTTESIFSDENGNPIDFVVPGSKWNNFFKASAGKTTVEVVIKHENLANLEKFIEKGFKEGFTMAMGNLDDYLLTKSKK